MNSNQIDILSVDHHDGLSHLPKILDHDHSMSSLVFNDTPPSSSSLNNYSFNRSKRLNSNFQLNDHNNESLNLNLENLSSTEFDEHIDLYNFENVSSSQIKYLELNTDSNNSSRPLNEHSFLNTNCNLGVNTQMNSALLLTHHMINSTEPSPSHFVKKFKSTRKKCAENATNKQDKNIATSKSTRKALDSFDSCKNFFDTEIRQENSSVIVPTISKVDDIFEILTNKIAKYCQVLSDLTNCEVFFKAQLPQQLSKATSSVLNTYNFDQSNLKKQKNVEENDQLNIIKRSVYWGTHRMLFHHSHSQGIWYDKNAGDSLIKLITHSFPNNADDLVEEILEGEPLETSLTNIKNGSINKTKVDLKKNQVNGEKSQTENTHIKDCFINLQRLNDCVYNKYLDKFESKNDDFESFQANNYYSEFEIFPESELYDTTIKPTFNKPNFLKNNNENTDVRGDEEDGAENEPEDDDNEDEDDDDEKTLLEKNCFNLNDENLEDYFTCEFCPNSNCSFKHLTQLKLHQLQDHENVILLKEGPFECINCTNKYFNTHIDYLKHLLLCFYPDIFQCTTCLKSYSNYYQYLFHIRYIHANYVYMCVKTHPFRSTPCNRKFRKLKDILYHDELMHSKNVNYCELCVKAHKSRNDLYEHYSTVHLNDAYVSNPNHSSKEINATMCLPSEYSKSNKKQFKKISLAQPSKKLADSNDNCQDDQNKIVRKKDLVRGLMDRKYQCKWCATRFYTKTLLKQHEATHVNSILLCPVCDKEFTHKDRLAGHMKCHMEPCLECKVCGRKFKRLCNLYNHELVHGLTEHAFMLCQFCGRGFRSRRDYQNHVIAKHRELLMKTDTASTSNQHILTENNAEGKKFKTKMSKMNDRKVKQNESHTQTVIDQMEMEPETYFTRTDTIVNFSENMCKIISDDENLENDPLSSMNADCEIGNLNRAKSKNKCFIKNKFKRLKTSLNIEVIEDDDENPSFNDFSHIINENTSL